MLPLPRAHHISRCAYHTVTRLGCRYRTSIPISATAAVRRRVGGSERVRPFSTTGASAGQEKAAAATSTAPVTDSTSADDAPKQILLYEAGSKRLLRISSATATMNGFFWSFYVGVLESQIPTTTWEPWGYVGLGCTALMFAVSHTFAKHWVSRVSYFPEWRLISVGTHTFFGSERVPRLIKLGGTVLPSVKAKAIYRPFKQRNFVPPFASGSSRVVEALKLATGEGAISTLAVAQEVKGDFFFSLLDIEDGVFHNRELLLRLLSTTPDGDVTLHTTADGDEVAPAKAKQPWKKRKRGR